MQSQHGTGSNEASTDRENSSGIPNVAASLPEEQHAVEIHPPKTLKTKRKPNPRKLPLDGGWGWAVVFGCSLMHFLVAGISRSYGVVYIELRHRFDSSASITAWVGGCISAIRMGLSPISTALSSRYGARKVVFVGGLLFSTGCLLSAFTPNTEFMFFSYSLLAGIGGSLSYAPSLVLVGQYFKRYRAIAVGLASAGSGFGCFSLPPLMSVLFGYYGYQGTLMIISSIMLHICVAAALYRPLEDNLPKENANESDKKNIEDPPGYELENEDNGKEGQEPDVELSKLNISDEEGSHFVERTHKPKDKKSCWDNFRKGIKKHIDFTLCSEPVFVIFMSALAFFTLSYYGGQMLVPDLAKSRGHTQTKSVFLLSIIGIADMCGRIGAGFFFDAPVIKNHRLIVYNIAIFLAGICHFAWAFSDNYLMLAATCGIHGIFNGCVVSQRAVILSDIFSVERLSSSFGFTVFMQGFGIMIGPALAGLLRDITGGYLWSYIFTGSFSLAGGILFFISSKVGQCTRSRKNTQDQHKST